MLIKVAMARGDQLSRQWKIIQLLMASRYGKSASEIAHDIDCHPRTIYRDLEALESAGFPLYTEKKDGRHLWSLLDHVKQNVPIPLSLAEVTALYFGRGMLKILENTVFHDAIESLFQKIRTTLPPAYLNYLKQVEQTLWVDVKPYKQYGRSKEIIDKVNDAAINRRYLEMVYYTPSRKKETRRKVAPYKIWFFDGTFYMIGHCRLRDDIRIFTLDRIKRVDITEEAFDVPEDFSFEHFMESSFGVFRGEAQTVRIRFSPRVADYIREKIWHKSQQIHNRDDGSIIFEARVAVTDEIKFWALKWGADAEVLEPESLRDAMRSEIEQMAGIYSRSGGKTIISIIF